MASIYGSEWKNGWKARLDYTVRQDDAKNESTVEAKLYVYAGTPGSFNSNPKGAYYIVQGHKEYKPYRFNSAGWHFIGSHTFTATHDPDGTKSVRLYAEWHSANATSYTPASLSVSKTVVLPRIPRASTVSASGLTIGEPGTILIKRAGSKFTHELAYRAGGKTYKITSKKVDTSAAWTPPTSLLQRIPDSTSGKFPIVCTTWSGSSKIGETETEVRVSVPKSVVPTIESVVVEPDNSGNAWVQAQGNIFVRYYSKAHVVTKASPGEGSKIAKIEIDTGSTVGTGADWTSGTLTPGNRTFEVTVTDTRGRTAKMPKKFFVYDYSFPAIAAVSVLRSTALGTPTDDGDHALVCVAASHSKLNGKNVLRIRTRNKIADGDWGSSTDLENGVEKVIAGFSPTSTYVVEVEVEDSLGNRKSRTFVLPTSIVTIHLRPGGKGVAIGKYSEEEALEVAMLSKFLEDVQVGGKSILGLLAAFTTKVELVASATMEPGFTFKDIAATVTGNTLRLYFSFSSTERIQPGDFPNKTIARIKIAHGGRIVDFSNAAAGVSATGGIASFYTWGNQNDGENLTFEFRMSSLGIAGDAWSCWMVFPVAIDPNAFIQPQQ